MSESSNIKPIDDCSGKQSFLKVVDPSDDSKNRFLKEHLMEAKKLGLKASPTSMNRILSTSASPLRSFSISPMNEDPELNLLKKNSLLNRSTSPSFPNILVVEDALVSTLIIKKQLESVKYTVVSANSGYKALDEFENHNSSIKIILMDINMQGIDGFETSKRIRKSCANLNMATQPLIYALTSDTSLDLNKCKSSGMNGYFVKGTFNTNILIKAVQMNNSGIEFVTKDVIDNEFKPTLLIVDDVKVSLKVAINTLKNTSYIVESATCGEQALEIYKLNYKTIKIILMDINMPGISGTDATMQIRNYEKEKLETDKNIPELLILGYTGNIEHNSLEIYKESGMNGCIAKGKGLLTMINLAIEMHQKDPTMFIKLVE